MIPEYTMAAIQRYVEHHIQPGGFLTAVLSNNLVEAFGRADNENTLALRDIIAYLYNDVRGDCWGSEEKVKVWLSERTEITRAAEGVKAD